MTALLRTAVTVLAMAAIGAAAGGTVAGKWAGSISVRDTGSGTDVSVPISMVFQDPRDGAVAGTIDGNGEQVPIKNGKLDGDQLTFEASGFETSGPMKFTLKIAGDAMDGDMKGSVDTQDVEGKVKLERQK